MSEAKKIGLIAGNGSFPLKTVENALQEGFEVFTLAIKGETDPKVATLSSSVEWAKLGQLKKLVSFFRKHEIRQCLMAGKITKTNIFKGDILPDLEMVKLISKTKDRKDDTLLGAIANYLGDHDIKLIDSTAFFKEYIAREGVLSKRKPSETEKEDITFGWKLAKEMGRLDIGQSVVVKNKSILAVEAIEGTDDAIIRGGKLGGRGAVVVKVAKPNQDMRFDVPAVGVRTLECMAEAGAKVLAVEAEKTLILDWDSFFEKLKDEKIAFVGIKSES